jgi:hypothetical protein
MSGDVFSSSDGSIGDRKLLPRTNIVMKKEDYCEFKLPCNEWLDTKTDLCQYCKWNKGTDVPLMIQKDLERRDNGKSV